MAGLGEDVELRIVDSGIVIEPSSRARPGWSQAARLLRERGDDEPLDSPTPAEFDATE